jgi:hypothetical protein
VVAENLIYFEDLALSLGKDKKSFFHGVHKRHTFRQEEGMSFSMLEIMI